MSESGSFDPGPWRGNEHNFERARERYDRHVGRSYQAAVSANVSAQDLIPATITTQSKSALVLACDATYSMEDWTATIFSKFPYLEIEGKEYLGRDTEISVAAIGDAGYDKYALQIRPFDKGLNLKKRLEELIIESGGGPGHQESYELAALYYARNLEMPNVEKPVFIFIGDEAPYDVVNRQQARTWAKVNLSTKMNSEEAISELKNKFSVYLIRKPYRKSIASGIGVEDQLIQQQWESYLGEDHIAVLPDPNRVVDIIFGILAKETSRVDYFREEIEQRQIKAEDITDKIAGKRKVEAVYRALASIYGKKYEVGT